MNRKRLAQLLIRLYPPTWRTDGRVEEIADMLVLTLDRDGNMPRKELASVALHAGFARLGWWLPDQSRTRIADLSAITGGGLAGVLFLFGEWQPWATRHDSWVEPTMGPFLTPGAVAYLLLVAAALCHWTGPTRLTRFLCFAVGVADVAVAMLPSITGLTRPSLLALGSIAAFAAGIAIGARRRPGRTVAAQWVGATATLVSGCVTTWAVICHADLSYDDRGDFNWQFGGLADIARYVPAAVAIALIVAVLLLPFDRSLLTATVVVALPWCLIGLRHAPGGSAYADLLLVLTMWVAVLGALHAIHVNRQRLSLQR